MNKKHLTLLHIALYTTVIAHYLLFGGLLASIPFVLIYEPWYVSIPIVSWLINIGSLRGLRCPLTELENYLRRKIGLPEIKGFVSKYILLKGR